MAVTAANESEGDWLALHQPAPHRRSTTGPAAPIQPAATLLQRKPTRVTFTAHWELQQRLQKWAIAEGRLLSNLISLLLETATS